MGILPVVFTWVESTPTDHKGTILDFKRNPERLVVPVPPEATGRVAESPAAVPEVFWFSVGKEQFARLPDDGVPKAPPGTTKLGETFLTVSPS